MVSIILKILAVLGIIILVLLGIILFLLLLVLFHPIFYKIRFNKQENPEALMEAKVRCNYLFGLVRAFYDYPDPGEFQVKVLWFTIYPREDKKNVPKDNKDEAGSLEELETIEEIETIEETGTLEETPKDDSHKRTRKNQSDNTDNHREENHTKDKIPLKEKIRYKIKQIYDKIIKAKENIIELYENAEYYKEVLLCEDTKALLSYAFKKIFKILKALKPKKLKCRILFGASSPDVTGYACAIYGMTASCFGKEFLFTPDFEQNIFEANVYASGHISLFTILWNLLMVVKDHRLWELKKKFEKNHKSAKSAEKE